MTHLTELAEHLSSQRLGEGDWDNVGLVAEWLDTSLNRCGLSLTTSPDTRGALLSVESGLVMLHRATREGDPHKELTVRAGDLLAEVRTILGQEVGRGE